MIRPILLSLLLVSCTTPPPEATDTDEALVVLDPAKADNFFSNKAREYRVEGRTRVELEERYSESSETIRLRRVKQLIPYRQTVVGWFLNAYLEDKWPDGAASPTGGFQALVKNGSWDDLEIRHVRGNVYEYKFQIVIGGTKDLLSILPTTPLEAGRRGFELTVGVISTEEMQKLTVNEEWYRQAPWKEFKPEEVPEPLLEVLPLEIWPEPRSPDAWIDTNRLFADGKLEVAVHFGWDHGSDGEPGFHLTQSKEYYDYLVESGFESPVSSFDRYTHKSGPLVATIDANGREISLRVWLRWGKPGTATDPDTDEGGRLLEKLAREDLAGKEVFIFSGHSGAFYGFSLANWDKTEEGDLVDPELREIPLFDGYQVVFADGCHTYGIGEALLSNPHKRGKDLDVITSTSFSDGSDSWNLQLFFDALSAVDDQGRHVPKRYGELLPELNWNKYMSTMYGVHGIEDNPHLHPYARTDKLCRTCSTDASCGGYGNVCARLSRTEKVCAAECTSDDGCPSGYLCADFARKGALAGGVCVPASGSCGGDEVATNKDAVLINEIGSAPTAGEAGDWNWDGTRDAREDEFVELVNRTDREIALGGWTLSDGSAIRFTFPQGATLPPNGAAVVFGGGAPELAYPVELFVAEGGLGLNDAGDTVVLSDARRSVVDTVRYSGGDEGVSLTRERDGDASTEFVPHPLDPSASPGSTVDGDAF